VDVSVIPRSRGAREKAQLMSASEIDRTLVRLAHEILEKTKDLDLLAFIGIRRRGVPLAQRLARKIEALEKRKVPVGILDINLYRDDLTTVDIKPVVSATDIPFSVQGKDIILMDDVLYTGRTIRAALDALFDHGRPARVQLLVLIDRGHRELPIEARFVGRTVQTSDNEIIEVKFQEIDGMEKVLLVERAAAQERRNRCRPDCSESKSWTAPRSKPFWRAPSISADPEASRSRNSTRCAAR
jgi:pyrimidine operon attenuation protein / uracil phosphoribosyltransferase